jgi:hypothetical protein
MHGPARWELQCLLNILPINVERIKKTDWPLEVDVYIEPLSPGIMFDPWQTFFQGTNQVRVPPIKIWQDDRFFGTNTGESFFLTNVTRFRLEFLAPNKRYLDQDSPFQLAVEGIRLPDQTLSLPPITFQPTTVIRPGFRLPY